MARLSHIWRDQRGNSLIEMGLAMPLLAALLMGTVDISRGVSAQIHLEQAAQRTVEMIQAKTDFTTDDIDVYEADAEEAAGAGSVADVVAWLECDNDGVHLDFDTGSCDEDAPYARYVSVSVTGSYTPMFSTQFFPNATGTNVPVSGNAVVRVQ